MKNAKLLDVLARHLRAAYNNSSPREHGESNMDWAALLMTALQEISAEATHAENQAATDYRALSNERLIEVRQHFPDYRGAPCLIVVGMEKGLLTYQVTALTNANSPALASNGGC